jgi:oxygen-independent coproporphyrinogen-3 oxidase
MGVYVHFPWCLKKCPYCDFLSVASERPEIPQQAYTEAVLRELECRAAALPARRVSSVFFGGGTPSLWDPAQLGRVLARIGDLFPGVSSAEVTVECNPTSLDRERARALCDVGVNRVSIGVQSLDAGRLAFLGRLHDPPSALRAIADAVNAGVPRISADLIFGVAGQSASEAASEAQRLADSGCSHLSAYALTIEQGTQFGALARKGKLPLLADDIVADSFMAVHEALAERGFEHYEISNYAQPEQRARHNLGYWTGQDYLGVGTGAWGTVSLAAGRLRYRTLPSPERYMELFSRDRAPELWQRSGTTAVSDVEAIDGETALKERLLLGLRLRDGFDLGAAARELGVQAMTPARERALARLTREGRVQTSGERISIPERHWLTADAIIRDLL